jgi:REP element-mobilizing transposase RayT
MRKFLRRPFSCRYPFPKTANSRAGFLSRGGLSTFDLQSSDVYSVSCRRSRNLLCNQRHNQPPPDNFRLQQMRNSFWKYCNTTAHRGHYKLHAFVVMPDHIHLLLTPQGAPDRAGRGIHQRRLFASDRLEVPGVATWFYRSPHPGWRRISDEARVYPSKSSPDADSRNRRIVSVLICLSPRALSG